MVMIMFLRKSQVDSFEKDTSFDFSCPNPNNPFILKTICDIALSATSNRRSMLLYLDLRFDLEQRDRSTAMVLVDLS